MTAVFSAVSLTIFNADQQPEYRESAHPYRLNSRTSCTLAGYRMGTENDATVCSLWCAKVEDFPA